MKQILYLLIILIITANSSLAQNKIIHPRGAITKREIPEIRERIKREPFKSWFEKIKSTTLQAEKEVKIFDPYFVSYLALKQAQMYILTGNNEWAEKSYQTLKNIFCDSSFFNNPISRGLTRATQLFCVAQCYDFCYEAWSIDQRKEANNKMYNTLLTVNSNMGFSANYAIESNWNGVRWGSVLLAALVHDNLDKKYEQNPALPFIWDTQKRLRDHIEKNVFPCGWSAESLSYHVYNWSFIAPALVAMQNNNAGSQFELENYAPNTIRSFWSWSASTISIAHPDGKGIQPDLSDDDPQTNYFMAALALSVYSSSQTPAIKWMHDYLFDVNQINDDHGYLFYSICWYPENIPAKNPAEMGWLTFIDESYGVSVWRNRFKDENDIVVAFNAPLKRLSGHKGPDNLTFRIIGLNNIWVTGGGRTDEIAGQTNLFPYRPSAKEKQPYGWVESRNFHTGKANNDFFFASAEGSCMGVKNHKRKIEVKFTYDDSALIKIKDTSEGGKIWRLNTPEFNKVEILENGFLLIAPNGSKMKVTAPKEQITGKITVTKIRYGGSTRQHNQGIGYGNEYWEHCNAVDIPINSNIEVTINLFRST